MAVTFVTVVTEGNTALVVVVLVIVNVAPVATQEQKPVRRLL